MDRDRVNKEAKNWSSTYLGTKHSITAAQRYWKVGLSSLLNGDFSTLLKEWNINFVMSKYTSLFIFIVLSE
jgi:hypothetical protein